MGLPVLYILRHGVTVANTQGISAGTLETPLTESGIAQAQAAGSFLKNIELSRVHCSTQGRARKTAEILNLPVQTEFDERLREMCFGKYEGISFDQRRIDGFYFAKFFEDPQLRFPNGENYTEVEERLNSFIKEKVINQISPAVIVTHGATGRILLATLMPHHKKRIAEFALGNADVIKVENGEFSVIFETEKGGPIFR